MELEPRMIVPLVRQHRGDRLRRPADAKDVSTLFEQVAGKARPGE